MRRENWRVDADGMLRVTANILKKGVFAYPLSGYGDELPPALRQRLGGRDAVYEYVDPGVVGAEVLASLEGKPVVVDAHQWQLLETSDGAEQRFAVGETSFAEVGSVAGAPWLSDDGYIRADLLIKHPLVVERIRRRDLIEVSAGYVADIIDVSGCFDGKEYDLQQRVTRFNHIAILPFGKGRCGRDVKILNSQGNQGKTMSVTIQRQVGDVVHKFVFSSEDDAREAERMCETLARAAEAARQNAVEEAAAKETEELKMQNAQLEEEKSSLEEKLDAILARLEKLAALEVREQEKDEETILDEELDSSAADEAKRSLAAMEDLEARRQAVVSAVARSNGLEPESWSQEAIDAQFQLLAAKCRQAQKLPRSDPARSSEISQTGDFAKRQNSVHENRYVRRVRERNKTRR